MHRVKIACFSRPFFFSELNSEAFVGLEMFALGRSHSVFTLKLEASSTTSGGVTSTKISRRGRKLMDSLGKYAYALLWGKMF